MGFLRLWLALLVMVDHKVLTVPFRVMPGNVAVDCFFVISGFIMVVIWKDVYAKLGVPIFLTNRAIRLFPSYLAALIIVVVAQGLAAWSGVAGSIDAPNAVVSYMSGQYGLAELVAATLANILIVGQDLVIFADRSYHLHHLILIAQAWSVALEIYFYLTVPWLTRRWYNAAIALAASALLRFWLYRHGYSGDDWHDKFALFAFYLFALGALSGLVYLRWRDRIPAWPGGIAVAVFGLLTLAFWPLYQWWPMWRFGPYFAPPAFVVAAVTMAVALPFAFRAFRSSCFDRYLGEYSYPLYLVHMVAVSVGLAGSLMGVALTVALAAVLVHFVEPVSERWRRRNAPDQGTVSAFADPRV